MKHTSLLLCLLMLATLFSCRQKPEEANLVILYTTDVHGACLPLDFKLNKPAKTSLANVCSYVRQQRKENPDQVILLDNGDVLQGQPSIYFSNFIDTLQQHLVAEVNNYMQYDAMTVGNHDIEPGEDVYNKRLPRQLNMPWLCANAIDQRTGEPMFKPYCIIKRQGMKIAVLGMITPHIHAWLPKSLWPNLEFQDMVECARHWVPIIREQEKPDVLVGLFHAGVEYNSQGNDMDTPFNENGSIPVATKVPGFDIVLCGHDHLARQFDVVNTAGDTVRIVDAQTQSRMVGRIDIHLSRKQDNSYQKTFRTSLVDMADYAPDSAFCTHFQGNIDRVNDFVDTPLGQLTEDLVGEDGLFGPSTFMDFIHDAQLWATGADISLAAVLSPHDIVPAGPITMRHLFSLYKYENQLFKLSMSGSDIKKYLEFGFDRQFATMKSAEDHLLAFKYNANGEIETNSYGPVYLTPTFNFTSAAGIKYTLDLTRPTGDRVSILSLSDGTPFDMDKHYTVAINSYQASGGGDFIPKGLGWDDETLKQHTLDTTPKDVRRYIAEYIQLKQTITPHLRNDWIILPHEWWLCGKERDKNFIHPEQR